jgi:hypothetical protein
MMSIHHTCHQFALKLQANKLSYRYENHEVCNHRNMEIKEANVRLKRAAEINYVEI